ncbi:glutamate/tyrosine decarboxylase-like PLP-dependent enzyme [Saonia flava]|uniref:Glutamate/tyrosine decarboxylase-like PLP-dependent enzyme n=1 Tax=Saonia flava TaxID=523696 RepID=A0A846QYQ3_9FLAO|nr:pyridoxal-dependent decarboxylase [Saonia flava]NJB70264.1 glutamate/tyrosine decarboxylase-like PLP-dependent enzyme [Saonia flava]
MNKSRSTPVEINKSDFKKIGYDLIDTIADFFDTIESYKVTSGESPVQLQKTLTATGLPEEGKSAAEIISRSSDLLLNHSLFNGHPKFMGYITSSPAPIGVLGDLLSAAVNQNVGAQILSPMATEIEKQTVQWLAEFIGVSPSYGGVLVSGGNMANFNAFLVARTAKMPKSLKEEGLVNTNSKLVAYCSKATHTWVEKAAILFGHGSKSIRWIPTDSENRMNNDLLSKTIQQDLRNGYQPFMVVGTAGDVSTGVVDNLKEIASICNKNNLWFHIDGAYGAPAAIIPEFKSVFEGMDLADSIAIDPHKWLYTPLEAGCTLVKNPKHLIDTYSSHPEYYNFSKDEEGQSLNFYEYGLQNSRGFKALKVWMALQQIGSNGYTEMIAEDIKLSKLLYELAEKHPELEAITQNLSITTFRYVPMYGLPENQLKREAYLNTLNETLLDSLQQGGEVFLSNAIVLEKYCLRSCIVNFRTSESDIQEIIEIVIREGIKLHSQMQKATL